MEYLPSQELKDAGFPFVLVEQEVANSSVGRDLIYQKQAFYLKRDGAMYKIPTLSELIEACGEKFDKLERMNDGSFRAYRRSIRYVFEEGKTPEEAVERLWLAPNKK